MAIREANQQLQSAPVALEDRMSNVELEKRVLEASAELQTWQANFKAKNGRKPNASEMLADTTAAQIMTNYRYPPSLQHIYHCCQCCVQ
jgi:hypothetical protein